MRLAGKVAFVGGGGNKMGRAVPVLFAQEGARVAVVARTPENVEETVNLIQAAGGEAIGIAADLTEEDAVKNAVAQTVAAFGKIDILYNNAGGFAPRHTKIMGLDADFWDRATRNNLRSLFLSCKYGIPELRKQGGGSIINVSAGYRTRQEGNVAYSAAKAGVIGFTQNLARELWNDNIRVNCVGPGLVLSTLDEGTIKPKGGTLQRGGAPEDAAFLALYFASDESAWVTGQFVAVDGGDEVVFKKEYLRQGQTLPPGVLPPKKA